MWNISQLALGNHPIYNTLKPIYILIEQKRKENKTPYIVVGTIPTKDKPMFNLNIV